MNLVIVPTSLSDSINAKIDTARDAAGIELRDFVNDKAAIFSQLLAFFDEHGCVPDFELKGKERAPQ